MHSWKWEEGMDGDPPTGNKYKFTAGLFKGATVIDAGSDHGFRHFKDIKGNYLGWCGTSYFEDNTTSIEALHETISYC